MKGYDYSSPGGYFVTICSQDKECLFGDVSNGQMQMNRYGEIVLESWEWLGNQYPYVETDAKIVMPNHFHGILFIVEMNCRGDSRITPTTGLSKYKPLGRLIGAFKTVSTRRINEIRNTPGKKLWQRNYFDRIIRNETELNRIREYIVYNPLKWESDKENPRNLQ